jgi:hypothetical protein
MVSLSRHDVSADLRQIAAAAENLFRLSAADTGRHDPGMEPLAKRARLGLSAA